MLCKLCTVTKYFIEFVQSVNEIPLVICRNNILWSRCKNFKFYKYFLEENLWSIIFYNIRLLTFSTYIRRKSWICKNFWWIYMFWDVLNTIWRFLENVGLSLWCMSPKFCGPCISRTNARNLMKLYIQLQLDIIWSWLDFGVYCSGISDVQNFWFF